MSIAYSTHRTNAYCYVGIGEGIKHLL